MPYVVLGTAPELPYTPFRAGFLRTRLPLPRLAITIRLDRYFNLMVHAPKFLNRVILFQDLDADALSNLGPLLTPKRFNAGSIVFRELDASDALYIVEQGSVVVSKHVRDDVDIVLTRFRSGDFFGEMGLFDAGPRSATAQVEIDSELWQLSRKMFQDIFARHPEIAAKICYRLVTVFIERLRATNEQAREAIRWGLEATGYSTTASQAFFGRKST